MILSLLIFIHIFIWCFILFAGFIDKKYSIINIKYIIPIVFFIHLLPYHFIVKEKIKYIEKNLDKLWDNKLEKITYDDKYLIDIEKYIKNKDNSIKIVKILKNKEQTFFIIRLFEGIQLLFKNSFQNPLSPQGMLILGYILNLNNINIK